jgi:hypothetical protein
VPGAHSIDKPEAGQVPSARHGRVATYADLEAVPDRLVAEILDGELVTHPRPAPKHAAAAHARVGISCSWMLDQQQGMLETVALPDGNWTLTGVFAGDGQAVAEPFAAVGFALSEHWPFVRDTEGGDAAPAQHN